MKIRRLEQQIDALMYKRKDYKAYYYQPYEGKYVRQAHKAEHELRELAKGS